MKILITGATGFVGTKLIPILEDQQHELIILTRNKIRAQVQFPNASCIETLNENTSSIDAVINLVGENVAGGRWSEARKTRIRESRIKSTKSLVEYCKMQDSPPSVFISASGIGYYGNTGQTLIEEDSPPQNDFLSMICQAWEEEAFKISSEKTRVVALRIGMVLGDNGGALKKMLTPFKLCLGGKLGSGEQYISWIHRDDLVRIISYCLTNHIEGPMNCCSPNPITNAEFTKALGKAIHRPTPFPVPAFILKLIFGEMSDIILTGQNAYPKKLENAGFKFDYKECAEALTNICKAKG